MRFSPSTTAGAIGAESKPLIVASIIILFFSTHSFLAACWRCGYVSGGLSACVAAILKLACPPSAPQANSNETVFRYIQKANCYDIPFPLGKASSTQTL